MQVEDGLHVKKQGKGGREGWNRISLTKNIYYFVNNQFSIIVRFCFLNVQIMHRNVNFDQKQWAMIWQWYIVGYEENVIKKFTAMNFPIHNNNSEKAQSSLELYGSDIHMA